MSPRIRKFIPLKQAEAPGTFKKTRPFTRRETGDSPKMTLRRKINLQFNDLLVMIPRPVGCRSQPALISVLDWA
jgi:hypothetical protein